VETGLFSKADQRLAIQRNAMDKQFLTDRVMTILAGVLRDRLPVALPDGLTFHDLCINALDRIYIADAIELEWSIAVDEDEIDRWQSFDDIVISVRNRMA
jgi:acyl carrier protein